MHECARSYFLFFFSFTGQSRALAPRHSTGTVNVIEKYKSNFWTGEASGWMPRFSSLTVFYLSGHQQPVGLRLTLCVSHTMLAILLKNKDKDRYVLASN